MAHLKACALNNPQDRLALGTDRAAGLLRSIAWQVCEDGSDAGEAQSLTQTWICTYCIPLAVSA
jgi:hypothetical protein